MYLKSLYGDGGETCVPSNPIPNGSVWGTTRQASLTTFVIASWHLPLHVSTAVATDATNTKTVAKKTAAIMTYEPPFETW